MKVFTLMQGIIFYGVFSSLEKAQEVVQPITSEHHWPSVHSFRAQNKKWHVYETELDEVSRIE